jgi:hypothetical protein
MLKNILKQAFKTLPVDLDSILKTAFENPKLVLEDNLLDRLYKILLIEQDERISNQVNYKLFLTF